MTLLVANLIIMAVDARDADGRQKILRVWTQTFASPLQSTSSKVTGATSGFFQQIWNFRRTARENEQLRERLTQVETQLHTAQQSAAENERLRELLKLNEQNDIKKVYAYSTVSQLGYMFLGLGTGAFSAGIFHVMTHAFFKALLFLGAGSVIHAMSGEQDLRKMGGLRKYTPITFWTLLCASVAIAGVPPFSGYHSKDAILASAYEYAPWMYWVGVFTAGMTAFYVFRAFFLPSSASLAGKPTHMTPTAMTLTATDTALPTSHLLQCGFPWQFSPC